MSLTEYHIILEEVLDPATNKKYIEELRKRGWIHTNIPCKKKKDDHYYLAITCTDELLGKVVGYLLSKVGWLIVERIETKTIKGEECVDLQTIIPF